VIHLAGTTHGDAEYLCRYPLDIPMFVHAVVPIYLRLVASFEKLYQSKVNVLRSKKTSAGFSDSFSRLFETCHRAHGELQSYMNNSSEVVLSDKIGAEWFSWPPY
jgi:hypothetical protein